SVVVSSALEPPASDETPRLLSETLRRRTSQITLFAIGTGEHELHNLATGSTAGHTTSVSDAFTGQKLNVSYKRNDRTSVISVKTNHSWIVFQSESSTSERVDLLLLDEADQVVKSHPIHVRELTILFFDPPAAPVRLKAVVQEPRPFEFKFAPPEVVDE
ncbi:MAG TPA: hypothetical protein VLA12_22065, partial [Planctomycetaceae bacterium]|nr:hypothetical protein [Planctomycetaceae bacterium]